MIFSAYAHIYVQL